MKRIIIFWGILVLTVGVSVLSPFSVQAANLPAAGDTDPQSVDTAAEPAQSAQSEDPLREGVTNFQGQNSGLRTDGNLISFIANIIRWTLGLVGTVFFVIVLYNGFSYMTAGGDSAKTQKAVGGITNAVIGLIIIMGSFLITNFVTSALTSGSTATGYQVTVQDHA